MQATDYQFLEAMYQALDAAYGECRIKKGFGIRVL